VQSERRRYADGDMADSSSSSANSMTSSHAIGRGCFSMDGLSPNSMRSFDSRKNAARCDDDDSHATGFVVRPRGSAELHGVMDKVDIFTSTLARAWWRLGGFTTGRREISDCCASVAAVFFSNTLPPAGSRSSGVQMLSASIALRDKVNDNALYSANA